MNNIGTLKKISLWLCALSFASLPFTSVAEEGTEIEKEETAIEEQSKAPAFETVLKEKYKLTDEQIKSLRDQGMKNNGIAVTAALAEKSGKTVDEVAKMRVESKMGWGKIAKELNVHPSEIGKGISSLRRDVKEERSERRADKAAEREEKKAARAEMKEARAERKAAREERKAAREERKADKKERHEKN